MTTKAQTPKPEQLTSQKADTASEQLTENVLPLNGVVQQARENPSGINPAGAARLQRTIGNQALGQLLQGQPSPANTKRLKPFDSNSAQASLQRLVARLNPNPAGEAIQRHAGHAPHPMGWSERRQHWSQAMQYLRHDGLARLTDARDEFDHANTHNPGDANIMAQLAATRKLVDNQTAAETYRLAGKVGHEEGQWRKAQKVALPTLPHSTRLLADIAAKITMPVATYKAKKYMERGDALVAAGDHLHAAVEYERAYQKEANNERLLKVADTFKAGGDPQRAANWYRKLLDSSPTAKQHFAAVRSLHQMGMKATAMFDITKPVDAHYTEVTKQNLKGRGAKDAELPAFKQSGKYAEELQTNVVAKNVQQMLIDLLSGKKGPGALASMEDFIANKFGVREATLQELLTEFARIQVQVRGRPVATVLTDIQRLYPGTVEADLTAGGWPTITLLNQAKVEYLQTPDARKRYKLSKDGGLIKQGDPPGPPTGYDTANESTNASGRGYAIYVMSPDGDIYAASHKVDRFHHSSFLAGSAAAGAGEIRVTAGDLREISNKSGHYVPGPTHLVQAIKGFKQLDDMAGVVLRYHTAQGKIDNWTGGVENFIASVEGNTLAARVAEEVALQGGWRR